MELWKDFIINNLRVLKDLVQLWEENTSIDCMGFAVVPVETPNIKIEVIPHYKNKSQSFPPLQRNIHGHLFKKFSMI